MKKILSTVYSRGDGAQFAISMYATDTGFCAEWSCHKCKQDSCCQTCMPSADPAFQEALQEVNAHCCPD